MPLVFALLMLLSPTTTPEVVITFTGPDGKALNSLRVDVGLPTAELLLTTDKQGQIRFKTWSAYALFAVFEARTQKWTALPETYQLKPKQNNFSFTIQLGHDPRGGKQ